MRILTARVIITSQHTKTHADSDSLFRESVRMLALSSNGESLHSDWLPEAAAGYF